MAIRDEVTSLLDANLTFDELLSAFHELFDECRILSKKYNSLKKEHASPISNFDRLKVEHNDSLASHTKCDELELLQKKNLLLKKTLEKFEVGCKSLNMILTNKGHVYRKALTKIQPPLLKALLCISHPETNVTFIINLGL